MEGEGCSALLQCRKAVLGSCLPVRRRVWEQGPKALVDELSVDSWARLSWNGP